MKQVLIIDDEQRNTFALSAVLKSKGYRTVTANNIDEAFALLQSNNEIGIILLDMMMPGTDGFNAIPMLKSNEIYKHIVVIAVTGRAMQGDREKCLEAGADNYVSKPVDINLLVSILDEHFK